MKKIALQVIAFNVDTWINKMLRNAAPFVDKIYLAYPSRPWGYSRISRQSLEKPTQLANIDTKGLSCDIEIIKGDWYYDEDTRNDLLDRARSDGFDWMIIQDADEFYTEMSWVRIKNFLKEANAHGADLVITPWINFWKTPEFVIENHCGSIKSLNEGMAIRCSKNDIKFIYSRSSNAKKRIVLDEACYHYGYVMPDKNMLLKIKTWAHTNEISNLNIWYKLKWLYWHESSVNLHPSSPHHWKKAIRYPLPQPEFYLDFIKTYTISDSAKKRTIKIFLMDLYWNLKARSRQLWLNFKKLVKELSVSRDLSKSR